jgi:hypothetical protein
MGRSAHDRKGSMGPMNATTTGNMRPGLSALKCNRVLTSASILLLSCSYSDVPRLGSSIAAPNLEAYVDVRDARDWRNPFLIANRDGIRLKARGQPDRFVPVTDLSQTLANLPAISWPYGKIVGLSETSLRSPCDDQVITAHLQRTLEVLVAMGIIANQWPP